MSSGALSLEKLRGKHLYLDCFAGIAGDMFLGALLDLGVPQAILRDGLAALGLTGYELRIARTKRMGIEGCDLSVVVTGHENRVTGDERPAEAHPRLRSDEHRDHRHPGHHEQSNHEQSHHEQSHHDQSHHEHSALVQGAVDETPHGHRKFVEIRALIERSSLDPAVKRRALRIFTRVAEAEAKLHGTSVEQVSFHEVGAIDSLVDIVGAALLLQSLDPVCITSRPVPLGHGTTRCAHGNLPVPSPAALEILSGCAVEDGGAAMELCTPTGAAVVRDSVSSFGMLPAGRVLGVGYGAGDRQLADRPNMLRVILVEPMGQDLDGARSETLSIIEANLDDMNPEVTAYLVEELLHQGARDAWLTPVIMKKGRPAVVLSALCVKEQVPALRSKILRESTTIGVREYDVRRTALERVVQTVDTVHGPVQVKLAMDAAGRLSNFAPEYESCKEVAQRAGIALKRVYAAAHAALWEIAQKLGSR